MTLCEVGIRSPVRRQEHATLCGLHSAARMMRDRDDLKTQRQHIRRKSGLDDFGQINGLLLEMCAAFFKKAADAPEYLEIIGDRRVVERKGHLVGSFTCVFPEDLRFLKFPTIAIAR